MWSMIKFQRAVLKSLEAHKELNDNGPKLLVQAMEGEAMAREAMKSSMASRALTVPREKLHVTPEAMSTTFENLTGMTDLKAIMKGAFVYPIVYPRLYDRLSSGMLLYGLPGTGKTHIARALAGELRQSLPNHKVVVLAPKLSQLQDKFPGGTARNISDVFEAARTSNANHAVIILDEVEVLAQRRDETSSAASSGLVALLKEMNKSSRTTHVSVIGITNYPERVDGAMLRRLDSKIYVPPPDVETLYWLIATECAKFLGGRIQPHAFTASILTAKLFPLPADRAEIRKDSTGWFARYVFAVVETLFLNVSAGLLDPDREPENNRMPITSRSNSGKLWEAALELAENAASAADAVSFAKTLLSLRAERLHNDSTKKETTVSSDDESSDDDIYPRDTESDLPYWEDQLFTMEDVQTAADRSYNRLFASKDAVMARLKFMKEYGI